MWTIKLEKKNENEKVKSLNEFLEIFFSEIEQIEDIVMGLNFRNRKIYEVIRKGEKDQKRVLFGYIEAGDEKKLAEQYMRWYNELHE